MIETNNSTVQFNSNDTVDAVFMHGMPVRTIVTTQMIAWFNG